MTDKPYTDADVQLIAVATEQHAIEPKRANADGHDPCSCDQWWGSAEGPSWDEHMADVALRALAAAGRLAPTTPGRHVIEFADDGTWSLEHPAGCDDMHDHPDFQWDCPVRLLAEQQLPTSGMPKGRYECSGDLDDVFLLGDQVEG